MNPSKLKICLVTPGHVSSTPRLIKEADALAEAGYDVRVVATRNLALVDPLDNAVIARAKWRCTRLSTIGWARRAPWSAARRVALMAIESSKDPGPWTSALAHDAMSWRLCRAAAAERADLYLGHCIGSLAAVWRAAHSHSARYAFDIEDLHDGETLQSMASQPRTKAIRSLQSRILPGAAYTTAAAPLIGAEYARVYGVNPTTILNVFPISEAPAEPRQASPVSESTPAILYWFSQSVGEGRGLEEMLATLAAMKVPARLHLRGFVSPAYRTHLENLAHSLGVRHMPSFLLPAEPQEMARLSAGAHAGLATEPVVVPNKDLCLANKIFTYMLAGVPTLLSPTKAHLSLAPDLGYSARVLPLADPAKSASIVDRLLGSPDEMALARGTAWSLARERYCWDFEKTKVLGLVASAIGSPR